MIKLKLEKIYPWLMPISLIVVWQLVASFKLLPNEYLRNISSPFLVFEATQKLYLSGELINHLAISTKRALIGLLIGGGIGFILGVLAGISKTLRSILDMPLQMLRNIPHLAMIPLVILWFGIDETAKIFLVVIGTFFPIYLNTFHGIRNIDSNLVEMANSYGLNTYALYRHVIFPGAMPSILMGLRFSLGLMWLSLVVAETISGTGGGIGYLAMQAREFFQVNVIILTILVYALLGFLADFIARSLERYFLRWNHAYKG